MEIKELKEVSPDMWLLIVVFLLATIIPGVLLLFLFDRGLFMEMDTFKLMLLAISITAPVWIVNIFIVGLFYNEIGEDDVAFFKNIAATGSIVSIPTLFIPIFIRVFITFPVLWAIVIGVIINMLILMWIYYLYRMPPKTSLGKDKSK